MPVYRVKRENGSFSVMANYHLKDRKLSAKATGILSKMLSLPDTWNYSVKGLAKLFKDGESSIASGLEELENAGYLTRCRTRLPNGQLGLIEYSIYEKPINRDLAKISPNSEKPKQAMPNTECPILENKDQYNINNNTKPKTNIIESDQIDESDLDWYRNKFEDHIGYSQLIRKYGSKKVDEVLELILDEYINDKPTSRIGKNNISRERIQDRLWSLNEEHIIYVFDCLRSCSSNIQNIRAYLLAALYNAPITIENYYDTKTSECCSD